LSKPTCFSTPNNYSSQHLWSICCNYLLKTMKLANLERDDLPDPPIPMRSIWPCIVIRDLVILTTCKMALLNRIRLYLIVDEVLLKSSTICCSLFLTMSILVASSYFFSMNETQIKLEISLILKPSLVINSLRIFSKIFLSKSSTRRSLNIRRLSWAHNLMR